MKLNFSDKHKRYIRNCSKNTFNIAEGAVRAGKTVDNVYAFRYELERSLDKIHLATGSTIANAKLNIGECNGFGLEHLFKGRSQWGKFKSNDCLYVSKCKIGDETKVVIFAGGGKSDSYKRIRGNSYGLWIATEINLHNDVIIKEAFNRQLAAKNRKIFWDLNPDNPNAKIYIDYIDKYKGMHESGELLGGYNYEHFTIFDNINISDERKAEIVSQYDKLSIWYKRDILGLRCIADGLIFKTFADNPEKWIAIEKPQDIENIMVGVDFGGNNSKSTFVATGYIGWKKLIVIDDYKLMGEKGTINPHILELEFVNFIKRLECAYPKASILYAWCDNEAQYLINGLRVAAMKAGLKVKIADCFKAPIVERIYTLNGLINTGRFYVMSHCKHVINSLSTQVWDTSKLEDARLDDGSADIDTADALEYSFSKFIKKLSIGEK